jgi:hypothetical protein
MLTFCSARASVSVDSYNAPLLQSDNILNSIFPLRAPINNLTTTLRWRHSGLYLWGHESNPTALSSRS